MRADSTGTGIGTVQFITMGQVNFAGSTGTVSIYYNPFGSPTKYEMPTFFGAVTGQLKTYMLVNNVNDLGHIAATAATRGSQYALGKDFSAVGFNGFAAGTTFTNGFVFDGHGGLGVNHTISNLTLASASSPVGLFPVLNAGATVRNLNLSNVNIIGDRRPEHHRHRRGNQLRRDCQRPRHQQHGERRNAERHRRRRPGRTA